ncbi:glycoside hydrolase family 15 protein [Streptomyces sp. NPDC058417]|uniref:glycoside hydrolase family 15 protein n=1 Tax=unclassified Streptomyces TaxID=2593676 RepID=UPI00365309E7
MSQQHTVLTEDSFPAASPFPAAGRQPVLRETFAAPRPTDRIEDHGFLGNTRTSALVDLSGAIGWWCPERFDGPAQFASVLGGEEHGLWRIAPVSASGAVLPVQRRYLPGTLILETTWSTPDGTVQVIDFMPVAVGAPELVRIVRAVSGRVTVESLLRARPGYGLRLPRLEARRGRATAVSDAGRLWLDTAAATEVRGKDLVSRVELSEGDEVAFTLSWTRAGITPQVPDAGGLLRRTEEFWGSWIGRSTFAGPHREAVERSLLVLKALTYAPTGAIVAAPTTSLPETIGGVRNWDYRYCWLRDSAFTVKALLACGSTQEAEAWIGWLLAAMGGRPESLRIMYGVGGERDLPESELGWLPGHRGSAPVRIGNAAAEQLQLDVYGEVVDALFEAQVRDRALAGVVAPLVTGLVTCLEGRWQEPDEGIWEVRGPRRHFVHSKVMAWVAVDRAVRLIEAGHGVGPLERWRDLREVIHTQVCEQGYDPDRNTFTQSYGSDELDAALLQMVPLGFLPPDDKRIVGTVEAVQRELSIGGGFLLRYHTDGAQPGVDGLPGDEGAFLLCSGWLIEALALIGRVEEARVLTGRLLEIRNDLGLLAEEWDTTRHEQVGNFPQGFSHIGVIIAATALSRGVPA